MGVVQKIAFLGTSAGKPSKNRNASSCEDLHVLLTASSQSVCSLWMLWMSQWLSCLTVLLGSLMLLKGALLCLSVRSLPLPDNKSRRRYAARSTQRQALLSSSIRLGSVNKIFITHMHGDHCLGLVPMLLTMGETINPAKSLESQALDIYGPQGIRELVRLNLFLVFSCRSSLIVLDLIDQDHLPTRCCARDTAFQDTRTPSCR